MKKIIIFLLITITSVFADITFEATIDKTVLTIDEQLTLTITISGVDANKIKDINLSSLKDFEVINSSRSQNISIVNGKYSSFLEIRYILSPTKIGKFTIPALELEHRGTKFKTQPIEVEVINTTSTPSVTTPPTSQKSYDKEAKEGIFLDLSINKKKVYIGEQIILTYTIFSAYQVTGYTFTRSPKTLGFWTQEISMPQQPVVTQKVINGKKFIMADLKKIALFPSISGEHKIGEAVFECNIKIPRQQRSFFDDFFDDDSFFSFLQPKRVVLNIKPLTINVLPLPDQGKPIDFKGAVGKFKIYANVDKKEVKMKEPITLKIVISGEGNIKTISLPELSLGENFKNYNPTIKENQSFKNGILQGEKIYEYVIIPIVDGKIFIPEINFSYFEPSVHQYATVKTSSIEINVQGKMTEEAITYLPSEGVKILKKDINYIKPDNVVLTNQSITLYKNKLFLLLQILPILLIIGSLIYKKEMVKLKKDIKYARLKQANIIAKKRLYKAKQLLKEETNNNSLNPLRWKQFYVELHNALFDYFGNKFNISSAGLTTEAIIKELKTRNISLNIIDQVCECLHKCDLARFSPTKMNLEEMKQILNSTQNLIIDLEKNLK